MDAHQPAAQTCFIGRTIVRVDQLAGLDWTTACPRPAITVVVRWPDIGAPPICSEHATALIANPRPGGFRLNV